VKSVVPADLFIHERALVESSAIGAGTRVWAFAHVMEGAVIGSDCNVCDHTYIEGDVVIGDRVTIKSGVYLWAGMRIEDDVFIGPQATFANDAFPRSRQPFEIAHSTIRRGASIGAGAVVLPGITIGERAMVGAGTVVTKDIPSLAVVVGNPARVVRVLEA
jgi:acetyltransferase-like isoleucine patch superfamily enzyme